MINPSKNKNGKISKIFLEKINKKLSKKLDFNQWKDTDDVIRWFRNIRNKSGYKFIQLDVKEFYPSITEKLLNNAITFVENYISISKEDVKIIKSCNKSLLIHVNETWKKTGTDTTFDVTMVSYDGSELCEPIRTWWWWWWIVYVVWLTDERRSLISSRDHSQRSSPSRISDTPRAGFEPAQNLSSGFDEWSCAIVITTTPRRHKSTLKLKLLPI